METPAPRAARQRRAESPATETAGRYPGHATTTPKPRPRPAPRGARRAGSGPASGKVGGRWRLTREAALCGVEPCRVLARSPHSAAPAAPPAALTAQALPRRRTRPAARAPHAAAPATRWGRYPGCAAGSGTSPASAPVPSGRPQWNTQPFSLASVSARRQICGASARLSGARARRQSTRRETGRREAGRRAPLQTEDGRCETRDARPRLQRLRVSSYYEGGGTRCVQLVREEGRDVSS
jgi:hypothetical protein